jgi:hypothetical protein
MQQQAVLAVGVERITTVRRVHLVKVMLEVMAVAELTELVVAVAAQAQSEELPRLLLRAMAVLVLHQASLVQA